MGVKLDAVRDLWGHYKKVFQMAWASREAMEPLKRLPHEYEFLPSTLALQETPVHPAPRYFMRAIVSFALLVFIWSILGKLDVVATAQGKIVPDSRSKIIQPMETASVIRIHVQDGQMVKQGNLLIELDPASTNADIDQRGNEKYIAQLDSVMYKLLLNKLDKPTDKLVLDQQYLEGVSSLLIEKQNALMQGQYDSYTARYAQYSATALKHDAELRSIQALLKKYEETLPILQQREADLANLLAKNFVSKHDYLTAKANLIEQEQDNLVQKERYAEQQASKLESERERAQFVAETRRLWLDKLHESEQKLVASTQEYNKASARGRYMTLTAPVDGVVQQLSVHTLGGVVTPAQPLMTIVPTQQTVEIEAFLSNQDVGFVHKGQSVEVKVDTFSFTKYGTLRGEVMSVSSDAIQDEKRGLIFSTRIKLHQDSINIDGNKVKLSAGMSVSVEIKTHQRRVIEYFLDPLVQHTSESLHER